MSPLLFIALFISTSMCGAEDNLSGPVPLLINGQKPSIGQIPYFAYVGIYDVNGLVVSQCGGAILSDIYVITAAHCVDGVALVNIGIGTGQIDFASVVPGNVDVVTINPDYKENNLMADLAIITVTAGQITLGTEAKAIRLPVKSRNRPSYYRSMSATITGFDPSDVTLLSYGSTVVMKDLVCRAIAWRNMAPPRERVSNTKICTNPKLKPAAVCPKDAGTPLSIKENDNVDTLIGIASYIAGNGFKIPTCSTAKANVFSFIGAYLDWITDVTGIQPRP